MMGTTAMQKGHRWRKALWQTLTPRSTSLRRHPAMQTTGALDCYSAEAL